jgi:hypothetical protein
VRFAYGYAQCITFYFPDGVSGALANWQLYPSAGLLRYVICRADLAAKLDSAAINVNNLAAFLSLRDLCVMRLLPAHRAVSQAKLGLLTISLASTSFTSWATADGKKLMSASDESPAGPLLVISAHAGDYRSYQDAP